MTYFAKPHESFCRENLSFLRKHLRSTVYESGILSLLNTDLLHDTHYKHYKMELKNEETHIDLRFEVSFVTQAAQEPFNLGKILGIKSKNLTRCLACTSSQIKMLQTDGFFNTLYDSVADAREQVSMSELTGG